MGYAFLFLPLVPLDIVASMALVWYLVAWQALIGASFFLLVIAYGSFAAHKTGEIRPTVRCSDRQTIGDNERDHYRDTRG